MLDVSVAQQLIYQSPKQSTKPFISAYLSSSLNNRHPKLKPESSVAFDKEFATHGSTKAGCHYDVNPKPRNILHSPPLSAFFHLRLFPSHFLSL